MYFAMAGKGALMAAPTRQCVKMAQLRPTYDSLEEWKNASSKHIYIGRQNRVKGANLSPWANPYPLTQYTIDDSLELYRKHILDLEYDPGLLSGYVLGCWCAPDARCHADVLIEMWHEKHDKKRAAKQV